jgi:biopolymer transport protein ExbD
MSQPTAMRLYLPQDAKPQDQNKAKESGAFTVLLGRDNNVFYYEGLLDNAASNLKSSNFGSGDDGIRAAILRKKASTPEKDFVVVIKPSDECTYKNVVDILDEMSVNVVKRYALVDITDVESKLIKLSEGAAPAVK